MKRLVSLLSFYIIILGCCESAFASPLQIDFASYIKDYYFGELYKFHRVKDVLDIIGKIATSAESPVEICRLKSDDNFQQCIAQLLTASSCHYQKGREHCQIRNLIKFETEQLQLQEKLCDPSEFTYIPQSVLLSPLPLFKNIHSEVDLIMFGAKYIDTLDREKTTSDQALEWYAVSLMKAIELASRNVGFCQLEKEITFRRSIYANRWSEEDLQQFGLYLTKVFDPDDNQLYQELYKPSYEYLILGLSRRKLERDYMVHFGLGVILFQAISLTIITVFGREKEIGLKKIQ